MMDDQTGEHLDAAIAALAELRGDEGNDASPSITVHRSVAAVDYAASLPGARRRWVNTDSGIVERYEVVDVNVSGVDVIAFGPHQVVEVVPA